MEDKEKTITLAKVLGLIIAVFGCIGILALIWAKWKVLQLCATTVFLGVLAVILIPSDK